MNRSSNVKFSRNGGLIKPCDKKAHSKVDLVASGRHDFDGQPTRPLVTGYVQCRKIVLAEDHYGGVLMVGPSTLVARRCVLQANTISIRELAAFQSACAATVQPCDEQKDG